jgi:hypothetical protein
MYGCNINLYILVCIYIYIYIYIILCMYVMLHIYNIMYVCDVACDTESALLLVEMTC